LEFIFFGACNTDVDVGQGSVLSSIISVLYIASLICVFEHRAQALHLNTSILSFVDNGLLISQRKTYNKTLPEFLSASEISLLFGYLLYT